MASMSEPARGPGPALALIGAGALVGFTMLAVLVGRGGAGISLPPAQAVVEIDFRAEDQVDGSIVLRDTGSRRVVGTIRPGEDGFVRGTLRGLAQARHREGLGPEQPFRLTRFDDGRLGLSDDATGRHVALEAFGPTNAAAFARFLPDTPGLDKPGLDAPSLDRSGAEVR